MLPVWAPVGGPVCCKSSPRRGQQAYKLRRPAFQRSHRPSSLAQPGGGSPARRRRREDLRCRPGSCPCRLVPILRKSAPSQSAHCRIASCRPRGQLFRRLSRGAWWNLHTARRDRQAVQCVPAALFHVVLESFRTRRRAPACRRPAFRFQQVQGKTSGPFQGFVSLRRATSSPMSLAMRSSNSLAFAGPGWQCLIHRSPVTLMHHHLFNGDGLHS